MNTSVILFQPEPDIVYTIDEVARMTRLPRHDIAVYCRLGIISTAGNPDIEGWVFTDDAVRVIRHAEHLRRDRGVNFAGLRIIFGLLSQIDHLQAELRFHRGA